MPRKGSERHTSKGPESRYSSGMRFFIKAIASGFAMSLGSAIFKKVSKKMGLDEEKTKQEKDEEEKAHAAEAEEEEEEELDGSV